jgi:nucleotide-binding universal stress UspA family protein
MLAKGTIIVPLDGSELSERSLPYAVALGARLESRLVLMIAAYISEIPGRGPWSEEMTRFPQETSLAYLSSVQQRYGAKDASLVAKVGYPQEAILETAREEQASLIVLSTHGRSGLSRWAYGSTAGSLLHSSHVPLLVIGKNVAQRTTFSPKHLLLPLDGSKLAEAAVPHAREIAEAFGSKLSLLRVVPFSTEAFPMMVPSVYWPDLDSELVSSAQAYLDDVRAEFGQPVDVHAQQGSRSDVLQTFAETNAVDLVVMSTHARAGVQRAILGSTADRMLEGPAAVLLVRPAEH